MKISKNQKKYFTYLRIGITLFLLYVIFKKINFANTIKLIQNSNIFYIFLTFITVCFFHLIFAYRWQFSLKRNNIDIKYTTLLKFHLIAVFAQNFLPSAVGGDLVRGLLAFKGNPKIRIASSIIICRIYGLFSFIVLVNFSLFFLNLKGNIISKLKWYAMGVLLLFILFYFALFKNKVQTLIMRIYNSIKIEKLKKFKINIFFEKINTYKNVSVALFLFSSSLIIQIISIFTCYFLFLSLRYNINIIYLFLYIPIITFLTLLPISLNGLGIREGLYYYFFHNIVGSDNIIFAFILLGLAIRTAVSLIGGILTISKPRQ